MDIFRCFVTDKPVYARTVVQDALPSYSYSYSLADIPTPGSKDPHI